MVRIRAHHIYQFIEDEDVNATLKLATLIVMRNQSTHNNIIEDFFELLDNVRLNLFILLEEVRVLHKKELKSWTPNYCRFNPGDYKALFKKIKKQYYILEKRIHMLNLVKDFI